MYGINYQMSVYKLVVLMFLGPVIFRFKKINFPFQKK